MPGRYLSLRGVVPLAALALFAAACGPASSEPVTPTLDSTTATPAPTSTTLPAPRAHEVEDLWIQAWAAATELNATVESLAAVATPEVAAAMIAAVRGRRRGTTNPHPLPSDRRPDTGWVCRG